MFNLKDLEVIAELEALLQEKLRIKSPPPQ